MLARNKPWKEVALPFFFEHTIPYSVSAVIMPFNSKLVRTPSSVRSLQQSVNPMSSQPPRIIPLPSPSPARITSHNLTEMQLLLEASKPSCHRRSRKGRGEAQGSSQQGRSSGYPWHRERRTGDSGRHRQAPGRAPGGPPVTWKMGAKGVCEQGTGGRRP